MNFYTLSYKMYENMPMWYTNPAVVYKNECSMSDGGNCNANSVFHNIHTGTHVDAPVHFCNIGRTIDEIPLQDFYYTAPLLLKIKKGNGECVSQADLKPYENQIEKADIVCVYTGYADIRDSKEYIMGFPYFSEDAALYLRNNFPSLKAVAIDTLSVEDSVAGEKNGNKTHHAFLDTNNEQTNRTVLLYEDVNLKAMSEIKEKIDAITAFPTMWKGLEGSIVNMVAICK